MRNFSLFLVGQKVQKTQFFMSNTPSPAKPIKIAHKNPRKEQIIHSIITTEEYNQLETHREQCFHIYQQSQQIWINSNKVLPRITKEDIAAIFEEEVHAAKYQIQRGKEFFEGRVKKNGRPFGFTDEELSTMQSWIEKHKNPPKFINLQEFIKTEFGKSVDYSTLHLILSKLGYDSVNAKPMDDSRYNVTEEAIDNFFKEISEFANSHKIPPFLCFNLDEEGNDEYVDAKEVKIIIKHEDFDPQRQYFYPVKRRPNHTTFLGCVSASGSYIKPLIVVKRATIEKTLILLNHGPDVLMLGHSTKGYINKELFDKWIDFVFVPTVCEIRQKYGYDGPGLMIADGCTAHQTPRFKQACEELNIRLFFLPPHSSNQLQVLDLGVFAIHKSLIKKVKLDEIASEAELVQIIIKIMSSWTSVCTPANLQSAWRAMGAVYNLDDEMVYLTFNKAFAIKLLGQELTKEQRQLNYEAMVKDSKKRINVDDFNTFYQRKYPNLYNQGTNNNENDHISQVSSSHDTSLNDTLLNDTSFHNTT